MEKNSYKLSRAWAEIHIDKIKSNIKSIKSHLNKDTKLMAVVKADAYGHGFYEIAKIASQNGADYLAVACIDEAKQIRRRGIETPVLILGATPFECVPDLFEYNVIPTVFDENLAKVISEYAERNNISLKIHIKIDTGMGRLGFLYMDKNSIASKNSLGTILNISRLKGIEVEGIFTHFSNADDENGAQITKKQFELFCDLREQLQKNGLNIPIPHAANSAAICLFPEMQCGMVRAGLILYGEYPSLYAKENTNLNVSPVMEIKARISQIKELEADIGISYGKTFVTSRKTKLATVCVGYADSYFRGLSNKAPVLIDGKKAMQVGNICMDQMVIDITEIDNAAYGDIVTLIGKDGENEITFSEIADILSTINYEIMCNVGKRVVKAYLEGDKLIEVVNYLEWLAL